MSAYLEHALAFECQQETLVAVLATPSTQACAPVGLVIVVGGPQYRVGAHRQFVELARSAAAAGFPALRFDCRGMGDSTGNHPGFEALDDDIEAAIDTLQSQQPGIRRVLLWGLCDGAAAAALYSARRKDPRVAGLALLNPWVRSEATLARTQLKHWYGQRLLQPAFWQKVFSGGVGLTAARDLLSNARLGIGRQPAPAADFRSVMLAGLTQLPAPAQVHLAERDATAQEFDTLVDAEPAWRTLKDSGRLHLSRLPGADHTLTDAASRQTLERDVVRQLTAVAAK
jgi:exosortase A-associated hydrolase 1